MVEKQRAREIYETILREKKDPGLLEWTAGNLFKARVFPIEAWSEKRIKIVYTQVLPLRGNRYRYSYGLRSDLLRTKPLRELSLSVQVNSALPLKSVTCPTHSVRTEQTQHSAQLDFVAQEYTPDRDFEVVCEIENRTSDVVVIPHRRSDDGYFLLQLMPPGREGNWQREVLPDGKPLELVLLCDTSASMDGEKLKQQAEFVATVLSSLGEKDRFWLAATDVETVWASPEAMQATAENIAKAREFLDNRGSLGWTNLDKAFEAVLKKAPAGAQIVYIGDGIVTAGESDPNSFVKKLGRLMDSPLTPGERGVGGERDQVESGRRKAEGGSENPSPLHPFTPSPVQFHAVTVGNTYDATVLKGIAAVGHGSVRSITGDQTPQAVAKELLNEIAQPGLRDLHVEFRGLKVAAVYPDTLPQVPAGTQQILVGRYLPTGQDQQGEVVVTGKLGSEPIRYAAKIDLKDAEKGNSFIPRLWARAHLDHLLQQGTSQAIRDEIISLSEQFHIITPYTSLLVLESDADRDRFGVKRRFEMRDGERFFAEGRDNANYELRQQQMKRAGDWRIGMRQQVLRNLSGLGRDAQIFQQRAQNYPRRLPAFRGAQSVNQADFDSLIDLITTTISPQSWSDAGGSGTIEGFDTHLSLIVSQTQEVHEWSGGSLITTSGVVRGPMGGGLEGGGGGRFGGGSLQLFDDTTSLYRQLANSATDFSESRTHGLDLGKDALADDGISFGMPMQLGPGQAMSAAQPLAPFGGFDGPQAGYKFESGMVDSSESLQGDIHFWNNRRSISDISINGVSKENFEMAAAELPGLGWRSSGREYTMAGKRLPYSWNSPYRYNQPDYTTWVNTLFPPVAGPPRDPSKLNAETSKRTAPRDWPDDAVALSKSLLRLESLWKLDGGIELRRTNETFDPRWKRTTSQHRDLALYSPTGWLTRGLDPNAQTLIDYCNEKQRGIYSLAFLLGANESRIPAI